LDPNHLVTTGSEGTPPGETIDFKRTHDGPDIDYATIHIWPQNWSWYDPANPSTYEAAEGKARDYFEQHTADAASLNKPLVLEEFGLARDWDPLHDIYDPLLPTGYRDRFYAAMYSEVMASILKGGPAAGDNFWAWAGQARPGETGSGTLRMKHPVGIPCMIPMIQLLRSFQTMSGNWSRLKLRASPLDSL
jgi:mannan endo-1,4-beta-mannosidase